MAEDRRTHLQCGEHREEAALSLRLPFPVPYPLLSVGVLQVVDLAIVPIDTNAHQSPRKEAIFSQNHKVGEEASNCLHHS